MTDEQQQNEPSEERSEDERSKGEDDVVEPYDVHETPESDSGSEPEPESAMAPEPDEPDGESIEEPEAEPGGKTKKKSARERIERWRAGAAGAGEALSRPGALGWKFFVIMSIGALIAAVSLAVMNTVDAQNATFWQKIGPGSLESLRVLLRAPIHLSIGMLAFALTAWAVGARAGRGDLAAARIGLAVSLAIMALELKWSFFGERVVVYLIAFSLYFATIWLSFRCPPRVAGVLIGLHAGLFAAIAGLGWLIVWVGL